MKRLILVMAITLFCHAGAAHVRLVDDPGSSAALDDWLVDQDRRAAVPALPEEMTAKLIADGLLRGNGWTINECTDIVRIIGEQSTDSFSFCYTYEADHTGTLVAVDRIFQGLRHQWEEVGWSEFANAVSAVYRSTSDPTRYVVVIVAEYDDRQGCTDVIVGVARDVP